MSGTIMREPPDEADRLRLRSHLDTTLFVDAGAGSGKTTELIRRVVNLVASGVPLGEIAAITFTEAAASELRHRLRLGLEAERDSTPSEQPELAARYEAGLAALEHAAIQTLHSFAQRILTAYSLEAGLPPGFEIADEVASTVEFQRRWKTYLPSIFDNRELWPVLRRASALAITSTHLSDLARVLDDHYDRLPALSPAEEWLTPAPVSEAVDLLTQATDLVVHCADAEDTLAVFLTQKTGPLIELLRSPHDDDARLAQFAGTGKWTASGKGKVANWGPVKAEIHQLLGEAERTRTEFVDAARHQVISVLGRRIEAFVVESATRRRVTGKLSFHDLLTLCRNLLRSSADARSAVGHQYQRLLLDEFQDTDPLQIEIATLIAGSIAGSTGLTDPGRGQTATSWNEIETDPGRLFFVGDPKQSIYRFRRADIELFEQAAKRYDDGRCELTTNFRTVPQILEWVNATFSELMKNGTPGQARFLPLSAARPPIADGPAVELLGGPVPRGTATAQQIYESAGGDIADHIVSMVDSGRPISAGHDGGTRPARYGDVVILVPSRVAVPTVISALVARGVPYRLASASLVWTSPEIAAVLAIMRCVDDPGDQVAIVGALRSMMLGVSDRDLATWSRAGGEWTLTAPAPDGWENHPVARAMERLSSLHRERFWMTPDHLMDRIVRTFGVSEFALLQGGPEALDRVRFAVDQARAFVASQRADLRALLRWIEFQSSETIRISSPTVDDDQADVVRIMTIHASKGLEFPITILAGLSTQQRRHRGVRVLWNEDGSAEVALRSADATFGFDSLAPVEEIMSDAERVRLLYVATTRAKDWLVVCAHHQERSATGKAALTAAEQIWNVSVGRPDLWSHVAPQAHPFVVAEAAMLPPPPSEQEILIERQSLDESAAHRREILVSSPARVWSATGIATRSNELRRDDRASDSTDRSGVRRELISSGSAEDDERENESGEPSRRRGRAGTAIGRAVHATLQNLDLSNPVGVDDLAQAQASAEGVDSSAHTVVQLVRIALASSTLARVATRRHWPEMYVAAPHGGATIEGYIDLLVDDGEGGFEIIDYKTDAVADEHSARQRAESYRLQAATYAWLTEAVTGQPVSSATLLFLSAGGAIPITINDLGGAIDEVLAVITSESAER